jgi:hypothetical protein
MTMALDYAQSAALMNDPAFVSRVKVAVLKFADYIMGEAVDTPAHNTRLRWAQTAFTSPDNVSQNLAPPVVMDTQVQDDGAAITDTALQTTVETVVNKLL